MGNDTGGYQTNPLVAQLYDQVVPYRERPDITFYVEEAVKSGGAVLEVGCGTGRTLLPIAQAGVSITGLDISTHMLTVCRQKLKDMRLRSGRILCVDHNPLSAISASADS